MNWNYLSDFPILTQEFIEKYKDKLHWGNIFLHVKLPNKFIYRNREKIVKALFL